MDTKTDYLYPAVHARAGSTMCRQCTDLSPCCTYALSLSLYVHYLIWDPHDLRRWIGVLKSCFQNKLASLFIQLNDLDLVSVVFNETANGDSKSFVMPYAPVHCKHSPWRQILVYLFLLGWFTLPSLLRRGVPTVGYPWQMTREPYTCDWKTSHFYFDLWPWSPS